MSHVEAVTKILTAIPLTGFVTTGEVFKIEASTSLRDALRVLNERRVTGCPVFVDEVATVGCDPRQRGSLALLAQSPAATTTCCNLHRMNALWCLRSLRLPCQRTPPVARR